MTVQTRVHDGISVKTRTWRKVYKTKGLAEVREGFYAQREHSRWGVMIQLKGKERIQLGNFGKVPENELPAQDKIFCKFCEFYCSGREELADHVLKEHKGNKNV